MEAFQRQQQQAAQQPTSSAQPVAPPQIPVIGVDNEKEARDATIDLSGTQQIFVMRDSTAIFAKRFNVSNAKIEFETYEKKAKPADVQTDLFESASQTEKAPPASALLDMVGKFTNQLNEIQNEIKHLREDVKNVQSARNSKLDSGPKPTNEGNRGASAENGSGGQRSVGNNGNAGGTGSPN
jgi:hypothetical protein